MKEKDKRKRYFFPESLYQAAPARNKRNQRNREKSKGHTEKRKQENEAVFRCGRFPLKLYSIKKTIYWLESSKAGSYLWGSHLRCGFQATHLPSRNSAWMLLSWRFLKGLLGGKYQTILGWGRLRLLVCRSVASHQRGTPSSRSPCMMPCVHLPAPAPPAFLRAALGYRAASSPGTKRCWPTLGGPVTVSDWSRVWKPHSFLGGGKTLLSFRPQRSLWDQTEVEVLLEGAPFIDFFLSLPCFPHSCESFSWSRPLIPSLHMNPDLRVCFGGTRNKTTCPPSHTHIHTLNKHHLKNIFKVSRCYASASIFLVHLASWVWLVLQWIKI